MVEVGFGEGCSCRLDGKGHVGTRSDFCRDPEGLDKGISMQIG